MSQESSSERRQFDRYETDLQIQFYVNFDVETKIDYRVKKKEKENFSRKKYHALSRNVSVEGLCFVSDRQLNKGDVLLLEIFMPSSKDPIRMEGEVKWSLLSKEKKDDQELYDTGLKITEVNGEPVHESIFTDDVHHIVWSSVLESVFGSFKHLALKRKGTSKSS